MLVLAHAGHWLVGIIYAVPVVVLIGYIGLDRFRHGDEDDELEEDAQ
jgi:hypothetical protein